MKFVQQNLLREDVRLGLEAYTAMPLDALGALEAAMQEFTEGFEKSIREAVAELDGLFSHFGLKSTDMARKPKDLPGPIVAMREFDHNTSLSKTLFHENKTLPKLLEGPTGIPKRHPLKSKRPLTLPNRNWWPACTASLACPMA